MAQASRTFRIFVSSTFSDLKAERNALQKEVFPQLRDLAADRGCRFQAIDLRWGVSEEASLDQQAMNICLAEIERCQQTSPRPNFIVLLGDRYGWCPPRPQIPEDEFKQILGAVKSKEDETLLNEWYVLDKNAVPPERRLKPRERGSEYEKPENWEPIESRLHAILAEAVVKLKFTAEQQLPYIASATEQEIYAGALSVKEASDHVFCFFRSIEDLPQQFNASKFLALVKTRLEQEYPDGLSKSSDKVIKEILETEPNSSAKDFAARIKEALEETTTTGPEKAAVKFVKQVLVDFTARDFQNLDEKEWTFDNEAHEKQNDLKKRLEKHIRKKRSEEDALKNVFSYDARWTGDGITENHVDKLCKDVFSSLKRIIEEEIKQPHKIVEAKEEGVHLRSEAALDDEGVAHRKFAEELLRYFVGRTDALAKIDDYIGKNESRSLAIVGAGGTGKSALLARAIQQTQELQPKGEIVYRFIGATPGSSDGRSLLDSLCREISRRYGANDNDVPTDYRELVPELGKRMQFASADRPLIVFLDSLDQLSASQDARSLIWLPSELPENVSVIASTREEDTFTALETKQAREQRLGGLTRAEGDDLLSQWLASPDVHRTLQADQRKEVLDKFEKSNGNPLYLKLAFEEARLWISGSGKPPKDGLVPEVKGIIEKNLIERLESEGNHGETLVSHALGYLAASRYGLAEDELVDLLSRDLQVYAWFFHRSFHLPADLVDWAIEYRRSQTSVVKQDRKLRKGQPKKDEERAALEWLQEIHEAWPPEIREAPKKVADFLTEVLSKAEGPRLPVVLWSRLSFDLAPYLTERLVDGSPLMTFYHRELGDVATAVFLTASKDLPSHARLADYFRFKADPAGDASWTGKYPHGLSELSYHLTRAAQNEDVFRLLTDFKFLEHKAAEVGVLERKDENGNTVKTYTGVLQLQDDFEFTLGTDSGRAPLIVTALDSGTGLSIYCPVCNKTSPIKKKELNSEITCPYKGCNTRLKINSFVIQRS